MNKIIYILLIFIVTCCNRMAYVLPTIDGSVIVNGKGKILFSADFQIHDFCNGLAEFSDTIRKKNGCIKRNGKIAFLSNDSFIQFYEGLACINRNDSLLFINKKGNVVLKPEYKGKNLLGSRFNWAYFSESFAVMALPISDSVFRAIFIDKKGKALTDNLYLYAENFNNGLASVQFLDSTFGYIDKKGRKKITLPAKANGESFNEGLAQVLDSDSCFFIDKNGKKISIKKYLHAEHFQNGRAKITVSNNGQFYYGFINRSGEIIIEPQYKQAFSFSEGLVSVEKEINGKNGEFETYIINKEGKIKLGPFKNMVISEYVNGIAKGWTRGQNSDSVEYFLINKKGKIIFKSKVHRTWMTMAP